MDRWMNELMEDGWRDGWMDGWMDGPSKYLSIYKLVQTLSEDK